MFSVTKFETELSCPKLQRNTVPVSFNNANNQCLTIAAKCDHGIRLLFYPRIPLLDQHLQ